MPQEKPRNLRNLPRHCPTLTVPRIGDLLLLPTTSHEMSPPCHRKNQEISLGTCPTLTVPRIGDLLLLPTTSHEMSPPCHRKNQEILEISLGTVPH